MVGRLHTRRPSSGDGAAAAPATDAVPAGGPVVGGEPPDGPGPGRASRPTIGIRRLVAVGLLAAVGFGLALVGFRDPSERDCSLTPRSDARYALELAGPYEGEHDHATYRLVTTKRGVPMDPARLCLVSFPGGVVIVVDDVRRAHIHIETQLRSEAEAQGATAP